VSIEKEIRFCGKGPDCVCDIFNLMKTLSRKQNTQTALSRAQLPSSNAHHAAVTV
jgi:hypothetical protein